MIQVTSDGRWQWLGHSFLGLAALKEYRIKVKRMYRFKDSNDCCLHENQCCNSVWVHSVLTRISECWSGASSEGEFDLVPFWFGESTFSYF